MALMNPATRQHNKQRPLGEHLLAEALLSDEQLHEAIEYQSIYGGKLGTSLIELGLIEEEQTARALSRQLNLHFIKPEFLMRVQPDTLALIPRKIALKHRIVPYHQDGKKLFAALHDATNLQLIDELSFQLDHIIIPLAMPEIRLLLALKKYYDLPLSPRYETLAVQLNRRRQAIQKKIAKNKPETTLAVTTTSDYPQEPDPGEKTEDTSQWPLLGDQDYPDETNNVSPPGPIATPEGSTKSGDIRQQLATAEDRNDISGALITALQRKFPRCGLVMVRKETINGWMASGNKTRQQFEQLSFPLQVDSIFSRVVNTDAEVLGPLSDSDHNHRILQFFDATLPQTALAVPLRVEQRLVSILYIQGPAEQLSQHLYDIHRLTEKAELAFKLLIIRNKILNA